MTETTTTGPAGPAAGPVSARRRRSVAGLVAGLGRDLTYLGGGAVLGVVWFSLLVTLVAAGVGTAIVIVGFPLLAATLVLARWGADVERARASALLGREVPSRPGWAGSTPPRDGRLDRMFDLLRSGAAWKDLGALVAGSISGYAAAVVAIVAWGGAVALLAAPFLGGAAAPGSWLDDVGVAGRGLLGVAGLVVAVPVAAVLTDALARGQATLAAAMLRPSERALLAARVDTLEATRAGAIESADDRLRRLERDLHDGAQHRLSYIAMELGRAREKLARDPDGAADLLGRAHDESRLAMRELRDVVRGIHPSVLEDRGLDAAVPGLAARSPVPVDVRVELEDRPPRAVEAAAYFVVAESLTNVGRHSGATAAVVRVRVEPDPAGADPAGGRSVTGRLVVEVADDGHGGATAKPGSGLAGLTQRVEALDGTLAVASPAGGPTTIRAELPCAS